MSPVKDRHFEPEQDARRKNKTAQPDLQPMSNEFTPETALMGLTTNQQALLHTQRTMGNRAAIRRWVAQREPSDNDNQNAANTSGNATANGNANASGGDGSLGLQQQLSIGTRVEPIAIDLVPASAPGDYPVPDQNPDTVMAKRLDTTAASGVHSRVQRDPPSGGGNDDNRPHWGIDEAYGYTFPIRLSRGADQPAPWTYQRTFVYRNVNLWTASRGAFTLDILHEPNASVGWDSGGGLGGQAAVTLMNLHWMAPWRRELELGLSGFINTSVLPRLGLGMGSQAQLEAHVLPWFSVTFGVNGTWLPPQNGQAGQFNVVGGPGALFHF